MNLSLHLLHKKKVDVHEDKDKEMPDLSNIFGPPGEGVHSYRIFNIAIVDVLATILAAYVIARVYHKNFYKVLFVLFILGIVMHRLFNVRTTIDRLIFPNV
jgi:hypothetical protein